MQVPYHGTSLQLALLAICYVPTPPPPLSSNHLVHPCHQ